MKKNDQKGGRTLRALKYLFTVPKGEAVTEKHLRRVLVSSVCSIMLCMCCLVSTTWAWFTVSVENTGNVIQIASVTTYVVIKDKNDVRLTETEAGNYILTPGEYTATITVSSDGTKNPLDGSRTPMYVVMTVCIDEDTKYYYYTIENGGGVVNQTIMVGSQANTSTAGDSATALTTDPPANSPEESAENSSTGSNSAEEGIKVTLSFQVSWIAPASPAEPVGEDDAVILFGIDPTDDPTTESEVTTEAETTTEVETTTEAESTTAESTTAASTESTTEVESTTTASTEDASSKVPTSEVSTSEVPTTESTSVGDSLVESPEKPTDDTANINEEKDQTKDPTASSDDYS